MDISPQPPSSTLPAAQPEQKSNTTRIIVIVAAVAAGLCLISCVVVVILFLGIGRSVSNAVEVSPQEVSVAIEKIASIDIPATFQPGTSMDIMGMTFVFYESTDGQSALMIFQMPTAMELTDANIRQLEKQMERQSGRRLENFKTIEQYDATIRGEPGKVIIQEGTSNGSSFRQMLVIFQGKGGLAMMSIMGPTSSWDQSTYDRLVKSIN